MHKGMTHEEMALYLYGRMKGCRITKKHQKKCARVAAEELRDNTNDPIEEQYYIDVIKSIDKL